MLSPTNLRKDTLIEIDGVPYKVVDYSQKQLGRGGSIVNTKLKNLFNGSVLSKTFRNDQPVHPASIERMAVQFLYSDPDNLHFMNTQSYETITVPFNIDKNIPKYILAGQSIDAIFYNDKIIGFEWPKNVVLKVVKTAGGDKGNSASATTKLAELETGIKLQVPQFIKQNESIKVDTRSGEYLERAK